jgi:3-methyladenine DNA glycosylase AlkD
VGGALAGRLTATRPVPPVVDAAGAADGVGTMSGAGRTSDAGESGAAVTDWREALAVRLDAAADPATREWWESYLKGTAAFRGVPMRATRRAVRALWREGLEALDLDEQLAVALAWFAQPTSEDKLAGALLVAEHLAPRLRARDGDLLARPFESGAIADWNVCDWTATKALHAFVTGGAEDVLEARAVTIAGWSRSSSLWQRRASVVAFVGVAGRGEENFSGFTDLVLDACARNLTSVERFAHTGPGWLLRELSVAEPERVQAFVDAHPGLSTEGRRMALARLRPGPYRRR